MQTRLEICEMGSHHNGTDMFLTHTWKKDKHGRDNHARVNVINEQLNRRGFTTWFDSQRMEGNIREKMAEGSRLNIHFILIYVYCNIIFIMNMHLHSIVKVLLKRMRLFL